MRFPAFLFLFGILAWAQSTPASNAAPATPPSPADEEKELSQAISEAGTSPVDFIRALEKHLAKYPNTSRRNEIERALVKGAIDAKDDQRIAEYGERVLAREPNDIQILDKVVRALLVTGSADTSERALKYARHYEELLHEARIKAAPGHVSEAQWHEEVDKGLGRTLACQARATGNLGKYDEAVALARRGYEIYPSAESAREIGRWLVRSGKPQDAIVPYADAFTIPDSRNADADRAKDRADLGDIYRKLHGSEKGLGDIILEAYDRTTGQLAARSLRLRQSDPNAQASNLMEFTISSVDGTKLPIASLKGKAVVFDFWATWCGPCRAQHPLYEEVKQRFHDAPDVVFLSIATDEERDLVAPFLKQSHWAQQVYFEDGLSRVLMINSIPTTIVLGRHGEVVSRMNGFLPDRFVDMLSDRIRDALKN
ncbi:MAG TPA: TlpA disulfide reductase family protein [Bryobacteraceae bacterium]|nr:TlpA disulfide reductase family protein [Bryobacteraceae bacterium]